MLSVISRISASGGQQVAASTSATYVSAALEQRLALRAMSEATGAGSLLARDTLVVRQKVKLFELRNTFAILDERGDPIGAVQQVNQSLLAKGLRIASDLDVALPVTLEVRDAGGMPVLRLDKPWLRWACRVSLADGTAVGVVTKRVRLGKARFALTGAGGEPLGDVVAENWRAKDFAVRDAAGNEVARVTKRWGGLAKELLTDADTYVIRLGPGLTGPLRPLALGACLAIDTVMKQKDSA